MGRTVLVLGDQLDRRTGALRDASPGTDRVVMVESFSKLRERPWHRHKLTSILSAMRHFAAELREAGFDVTYRSADSLRAGLAGFDPAELVVMAPSHWGLRQQLPTWGVEEVGNDAFIVGEQGFRTWADRRERGLLLEDFYREERERLFPVTRSEALASLQRFLDRGLDGFGPLEDAVVGEEPFLWHSLLSAPLNLGLLHPAEICDRVDAHHRQTGGALNSHEGVPAPGVRVAGVRVGAVLVPHAAVARGQRPRSARRGAALLLGRRHRDALRRLHPARPARARLDPPHPAPDDHGQLRAAGRRGPAEAGRLVPLDVHRRLRLGDGAQRRWHEPVGRRRGDGLYWDFLARNRETLGGNFRMSRAIAQLDRFSADERRRIRARAQQFRADVDS